MSGKLIISLDFELYWGVRDHRTLESYKARLQGAREAIPRILDMFNDHGIHATWATIGFLMFDNKEELMAGLPADRPSYQNNSLSPYGYLDSIGANETEDPFHFAPSLVDRIAATPGQEIALHTLSHYYVLEEGQTKEQFRADIRAAKAACNARGIDPTSIVFPRNQYSEAHLQICYEEGVTAYRGNQPQSMYQSSDRAAYRSPRRRAMRLLDSALSLSGPNTFTIQKGTPTNVRASAFFRPAGPMLGMHLARVKGSMTYAARYDQYFHLWWHPHNFGDDVDACMASLESILKHYRHLEMESLSMSEAADQ